MCLSRSDVRFHFINKLLIKADVDDIIYIGSKVNRWQNYFCVTETATRKVTTVMALSYNRLWKMLIDRGMTKTDLRIAAKISTNALAKMGKNECVSMETLGKITAVLRCGIDDIVEINVNEGDGNDT